MDAQTAYPALMDLPGEPVADDAVFLRARAGEQAAFRQLVQRHQAEVFSVALRFTGIRADAEELAQDAFLQLHRSLAQLQGTAHVHHWLLRTVAHRALDRLRQRRRRGVVVPLEALDADSEAGAPDAADPLAAAHLRRLLLGLAPEARMVMVLRFQSDLDPTDIAAVLGMSINTVKSHLRRSLEWMRRRHEEGSDGS